MNIVVERRQRHRQQDRKMADSLEYRPNSYPENECPTNTPFDHESIELEQRMVSETQIWLNSSKTIQIKMRLSPTLNFLPTLKIEDSTTLVSLSFDAFETLTSSLLLLDEDAKNNNASITFEDDNGVQYELTYLLLLLPQSDAAAVLRITKESHYVIILGKECYRNLINFFDIIRARFNLLHDQ